VCVWDVGGSQFFALYPKLPHTHTLSTHTLRGITLPLSISLIFFSLRILTRLTSTGSFDTTFATGGKYVSPRAGKCRAMHLEQVRVSVSVK